MNEIITMIFMLLPAVIIYFIAFHKRGGFVSVLVSILLGELIFILCVICGNIFKQLGLSLIHI